MNAALQDHLASGLTTTCQCWQITRADGVIHCFTDHDRDVSFAGLTFRADSGLSARALAQTTGLAVDNTEAMGILSDDAIAESAIEEGRFDGAEVRIWLVNWSAPGQRNLRFRGTIGEVRRGAGAFHAELRGLTEALNAPTGRAYMRVCPAVLGDAACGVNLASEFFGVTGQPLTTERSQAFTFAGLAAFDARWFERGRLSVLSGAAEGLSGIIKHDRSASDGTRRIELWEPIRASVGPGDLLRLTAGCDKRAETCRFKFDNIANFRGFPFIPGEDWLMTVPATARDTSGGSLRE